jgi:hypothetical protein
MRLHRHMRIEMIQRAIRLLAPLPPAFVHALDFFIPATRTLVLLRSGDGHKGVDLGEGVRILMGVSGVDARTRTADVSPT